MITDGVIVYQAENTAVSGHGNGRDFSHDIYIQDQWLSCDSI